MRANETSKGSWRLTAIAVAALVAIPSAGLAAEDPPAPANDEAARYTAQTERIKAETAMINARAARSQARVDALGLPEFNGATTLSGEGAGRMEATLLSTDAIGEAATLIAGQLGATGGRQGQVVIPNSGTRDYIIVAGDEALDFGMVGAISVEMDAIQNRFSTLLPSSTPLASAAENRDPALIIGAITAAAGLLRSETTVSAVDTPAISARMLTSAIAARLRTRAILPSAAISTTPVQPVADSVAWGSLDFLQRFNRLAELRQRAVRARDAIPANTTKNADKRRRDELDNAITRYDGFYARVTTASESGEVPIAQAGAMARLLRPQPHIVRLYVAAAGGSFINTKNITTFFGADPIRVTGGLVVEFNVTDPTNGQTQGGGVVRCQTALTTLRSVQDRSWTRALAAPGGHARSLCEFVAETTAEHS